MLAILVGLATIALVAVFSFPKLLRYCGALVGNHVRTKSDTRRAILMERADTTDTQNNDKTPGLSPVDSPDREWNGIVAFLHPFWLLINHHHRPTYTKY